MRYVFTGKRERHIGEAGKHIGHVLELLESGKVYCCDCEKTLSFPTADKAWPPQNSSTPQSEATQ